MRLNSIILLILLVHFTVSAQEAESGGKRELEVLFGFNALGPAREMHNLMTEYGFDDKKSYILTSWIGSLFGHAEDPPDYTFPGLSTQISYTTSKSSGRSTGFMLKLSSLRGVEGYSDEGGYLTVGFSSIAAVLPLYKITLKKNLELLTGPSIMINSGNKRESYYISKDRYTKASIGALAGLQLKIWDNQTTGKIGFQYLFSTPNIMGPYQAFTQVPYDEIPETRFWFGHLTFGLVLGIRL